MSNERFININFIFIYISVVIVIYPYTVSLYGRLFISASTEHTCRRIFIVCTVHFNTKTSTTYLKMKLSFSRRTLQRISRFFVAKRIACVSFYLNGFIK